MACQEGEAREGGEEEQLLKDPNGVNIEQCAQCLLPLGTTTGHFLLLGWGVGREVVASLRTEEVGQGVPCTLQPKRDATARSPPSFQKLRETQVGPRLGGSIGAWHIPLFLTTNRGTCFSFPSSQRIIGMGLTRGGSKIVSRVGAW